jgi:hypothetical protein
VGAAISPIADSERRPPQPGDIVRVRSRTYLVESVEAGGDPVVSAVCLDDDGQGDPLEVVWTLELATEILGKDVWKSIGKKGFDSRRCFAAYIHTLRWNCVTATDPRLFQCSFRAGIRLDAYQLECLRKAPLLPRVNLFIADDVGLGKTIEAGLIASELLLRRSVREIVVACRPTMLPQWKDLLATGIAPQHVALILDAIAEVREYAIDPAQIFDLVLSGPEVPGINTADTLTTPRMLIADTRREVLMIGYAVHNAKPIFELLASRMEKDNVRVLFCIEIGRRMGDTSLDSEIGRRFACEFREKHWPRPILPKIYYDPRSLSQDPVHRSSLHAKCLLTFAEYRYTQRRPLGADFQKKRSSSCLNNIQASIIADNRWLLLPRLTLRMLPVDATSRSAFCFVTPTVLRLLSYFEGLISKTQMKLASSAAEANAGD